MHIAIRNLWTSSLPILGLRGLPYGEPYYPPYHPHPHHTSTPSTRTSSTAPIISSSTLTSTSPVITSASITTPVITSSTAPVSTPSTASPVIPSSTTFTPSSTPVTTPVLSTTTMRYLSSTLTSALTIFVTVTSAVPQNDVFPNAIQGLSDCGQRVIFPLLTNSQCNPADFPCICTELTRLQAEAAVEAACDNADVNLFLEFQSAQCGTQIALIQPPAAPPAAPPASTPAATPAAGVVVVGTNNQTNGTTTTALTIVPLTTTTAPTIVPLTTTNATLPIINNATNGTVIVPAITTAVTVSPTARPKPKGHPTSVAPGEGDQSVYAGAAVLGAEVPGFGVWGVATGLTGLMVLAFAEL